MKRFPWTMVLALSGVASATGQVAPKKPAAADDFSVLIEALRYRDPQIRRKAAELLAKLGPAAKEAAPALITALAYGDKGAPPDSPEEKAAAAVRHALTKIGPAAVPGLAAAVKSGPRHVSERAAASLADMGREARSAVPEMVAVLKVEDAPGWRRGSALLVLSKLGSESKPALDVLIGAIDDPQPGNRMLAIGLLRDLGTEAKAAVGPLVKLVESDPSTTDEEAIEVRNWAIVALGSIGPAAKQSAPALKQALSKAQDNQSKLRIIVALGKVDPSTRKEMIQTLITMLGATDSWSRRAAARTLGQFAEASAPAVAALVERLRDESVEVRQSAAQALGNLGPVAADALPALERALKVEKLLGGTNHKSLSAAIDQIRR